MTEYRNTAPVVDIIIEIGDRIVLIERMNPPYGWTLPGGFVDEGGIPVLSRRAGGA